MSATPVKDSLPVFVEGARVNFNLHGHVSTVFATNFDGQPQIMCVLWKTAEDKEHFVKNVREWIAAKRVTEFILVSEAWSGKYDEGAQEWLREHGTLAKYPGRSEIVQVLYCSAAEEICYTAEIKRGTISTLEAWREDRRPATFNYDDFSTRFQGLFLRSQAGQN